MAFYYRQFQGELLKALGLEGRSVTHIEIDVPLRSPPRLTETELLRDEGHAGQLVRVFEMADWREVQPGEDAIVPHDCGPVETCDCVNPPRESSVNAPYERAGA